jgi:serine/threonine protein kinase
MVESLGPYRIESLLGEGGMGRVYCALDTRLQRQVALKVLKDSLNASPDAKQRFLREARAMAAIHHDNVVMIFDVGEQDGTLYLATELLQGATLEQLLERDEPFSPRQVVRLARDIANGLHAAHQKGLIHRDVKPGNIWLEPSTQRGKLLDFGLAMPSGPIDPLGKPGAVAGTPQYLSPEQAQDEPADTRSDLYSLGVVMFQLLAKRLPFPDEDLLRLLIRIIGDPAPKLSTVAKVPPSLASIVDQLLLKDPWLRPQRADELATKLDTLLPSLPADVRELVIPDFATTAAAAASKHELDKKSRRSSKDAIVAVNTPSTSPTPADTNDSTHTAPRRSRKRRDAQRVAIIGTVILLLAVAGLWWRWYGNPGVTAARLPTDDAAPRSTTSTTATSPTAPTAPNAALPTATPSTINSSTSTPSIANPPPPNQSTANPSLAAPSTTVPSASVRASAPAAIANDRAATANNLSSVTIEQWQSLHLIDAKSAASTTPIGEGLVIDFQIQNAAAAANGDPKAALAGVREAAKVVAMVKREGESDHQPAAAFPLRLSARALPDRGTATTHQFRIDTDQLTPGKYTVSLRLQSGDGRSITEANIDVELTSPANPTGEPSPPEGSS